MLTRRRRTPCEDGVPSVGVWLDSETEGSPPPSPPAERDSINGRQIPTTAAEHQTGYPTTRVILRNHVSSSPSTVPWPSGSGSRCGTRTSGRSSRLPREAAGDAKLAGHSRRLLLLLVVRRRVPRQLHQPRRRQLQPRVAARRQLARWEGMEPRQRREVFPIRKALIHGTR